MAALSGAAAGAAVGGIAGALIGMGIPEIEAKHYEGKIRGGNIPSRSTSSNAEARKAVEEVLKRGGAHDVTMPSEGVGAEGGPRYGPGSSLEHAARALAGSLARPSDLPANPCSSPRGPALGEARRTNSRSSRARGSMKSAHPARQAQYRSGEQRDADRHRSELCCARSHYRDSYVSSPGAKPAQRVLVH